LGKGSIEEQEAIVRFCKSKRFEEFCNWAAWETVWVRETFLSLSETHPSVKPEITRECVSMMKAIATFDHADVDRGNTLPAKRVGVPE
jgi:hypothetical protein